MTKDKILNLCGGFAAPTILLIVIMLSITVILSGCGATFKLTGSSPVSVRDGNVVFHDTGFAPKNNGRICHCE